MNNFKEFSEKSLVDGNNYLKAISAEKLVKQKYLKDDTFKVVVYPCFNQVSRFYNLVAIAKENDDFDNALSDILENYWSCTSYNDKMNKCSPELLRHYYAPLEEYSKKGFRLFVVNKSELTCTEISTDVEVIRKLYISHFPIPEKIDLLEEICSDALNYSDKTLVTNISIGILQNEPDFKFIPSNLVGISGQALLAYFAAIYMCLLRVMELLDSSNANIALRSDGRLLINYPDKGGDSVFTSTDTDTKGKFETNVFYMFCIEQDFCIKQISKLFGKPIKMVRLLRKILEMLQLNPDSSVNYLFTIFISCLWKHEHGEYLNGCTAICKEGIVEFVRTKGQSSKTIRDLTLENRDPYDSEIQPLIDYLKNLLGAYK